MPDHHQLLGPSRRALLQEQKRARDDPRMMQDETAANRERPTPPSFGLPRPRGFVCGARVTCGQRASDRSDGAGHMARYGPTFTRSSLKAWDFITQNLGQFQPLEQPMRSSAFLSKIERPLSRFARTPGP